MPAQEKLESEILPLELGGLLPLMRESYGPAYFGDERIRRIFNQVTRVVGLVETIGGLAAAAMLEDERIISVSASNDIDRFGKRKDLMADLLIACHEVGQATWISVGEQYQKMFAVCQLSQMQRVEDTVTLQTILSRARQGHQYTIEPDEHGLPIVVTNTGVGTGNRQQIWAWPPEA